MDPKTWLPCIFFLIAVTAGDETQAPNSSCPKDIVRQAMRCFSDLASGVTKGRQAQFTGSMPLDYHLIREYCQEGGHMTRFLACIDNLQKQCENAQEAEVLLQIINPERVRTSVPNLCGNIELIEGSADCLNREMSKDSSCKASAKDMIKKGMAQTPRNVTAMFIVQCRFFNILAECQRASVSTNCGEKQANLHADFILSFVPNTCHGDDDKKDDSDSDNTASDVTTKKPLRTSEQTATMLGVFPSKSPKGTNKTGKKDAKKPGSKPKDDFTDQVLKTLPPFVKDEDKDLGLKSRRHLEDGKTTSNTNASSALNFYHGLVLTALIFLRYSG